MLNILVQIVLLCTALVTGTESSELSECLREFGVAVDSNLIEKNVASSSVYDDINFQWQERGTYRHPKAYLQIHSAADVQSAIKCGRNLGLEVIARSGGHGYIKSAYGRNDDKTLILDLKAFRSISVDQVARTAAVDTGARLGHVAYELWENGNFAFSYGVCASVGIGGFTLGGGHSLFAYKLGMAIDNVIEMEMVNADGELLTINNKVNADLFWALRGAGATGSYGIVTKIVFQLHPAYHHIIHYDLQFKFEQFHQVYSAFQAYVDHPLNCRFTLHNGVISVTVSDIQSITESETFGHQRILNALELLPTPEDEPRISVLTFPDFLTKFVRIARPFGYIRPNVNLTEPKDLLNVNSYGTGSEWFKAKSLFVNKLLNASEIMELQQLLVSINSPDLHLNVETFSGKVNEFDPHTHASFLHRDAYYDMFVYMVREKDDDLAVSAKLNEFFEKSKEILNHTTSFQNYADDEMSDALERYFGSNLPRLIDIKAKVDPDNFFSGNPQPIPLKNGSRPMFSSIVTILTLTLFIVLDASYDFAM